jgi:hypothetical protein
MSLLSHLVADSDAEPTVTAWWIQRQLGHKGSDKLLEAFLEGLIAQHGFPEPLPHQKWGGGLDTALNARRSRWLRVAVLAWLDNYLPPEAVVSLDAAHQAAAAEDMDQAAGNLRLVGGIDA